MTSNHMCILSVDLIFQNPFHLLKSQNGIEEKFYMNRKGFPLKYVKLISITIKRTDI